MGSRIPLVLVPGTLCDAALWRHQTQHLADIAEIAVADHTGAETMDAIAGQILTAAPPTFALAGLSMGGYVAFAVMRAAPGRVRALALLDTSARADEPEMRQRREDLNALVRRGSFKGVTPRMLPMFIHPDRLKDEALCGDILRMGERVGAEAFLRQQAANMSRPDSRPTLGAIRCPTLVVCGRQDKLTPLAMSQEIAAGIPKSTLVVIEDCGHLPTMERPQAATAVMRYWLLGA
jgi:pimeloyl-ACP methyl ester carboxylesterase